MSKQTTERGGEGPERSPRQTRVDGLIAEESEKADQARVTVPTSELIPERAPYTTVAVSGVWLRTTLTGRVEVLVERDGRWRLAIDVANGDNISHIVEAAGLLVAPVDPLTEM